MGIDLVTLELALLLGTAGLGAGFYEALLIDRAWPRLPHLIQPQSGGIDRKLFWGPLHSLYELALVTALWLNWARDFSRSCVLAALGLHVATRVWSFAYFIPAALRFERASHLPSEQEEAARTWVRQSRWRLVIEALAIAPLMLILYGRATS